MTPAVPGRPAACAPRCRSDAPRQLLARGHGGDLLLCTFVAALAAFVHHRRATAWETIFTDLHLPPSHCSREAGGAVYQFHGFGYNSLLLAVFSRVTGGDLFAAAKVLNRSRRRPACGLVCRCFAAMAARLRVSLLGLATNSVFGRTRSRPAPTCRARAPPRRDHGVFAERVGLALPGWPPASPT